VIEIKPVLLRIEPWDATKGTSVYFTHTGSKQSLDNEMVITDIATREIVYKFVYSSFEKVHHLPPNELINGKVYEAKLRTRDVDGVYSPYSNIVHFRTLKNPILDIVSIDGQGYVYNQDVTFQATYSQENDEKVKNYRFSLYDDGEDLIKRFPVRSPMEVNQINEVVKGLEKGKGYFIECLIETVNGLVYTHRERFIPMYIVPSINGVISTRNDPDEGFIRITSNLKQILGTQVKGTPKEVGDLYDSDNYVYENDDWIIIPEEKPVIFTGLGMNKASDFVMKVWCKNILENSKFLEISPAENEGIAIEFWKYKDRVVATKELNGKVSRYRSNILTVPKNVGFMLYVRVVEHRIELSIQLS
jgi:hypothetical protein